MNVPEMTPAPPHLGPVWAMGASSTEALTSWTEDIVCVWDGYMVLELGFCVTLWYELLDSGVVLIVSKTDNAVCDALLDLVHVLLSSSFFLQ